MSDRKYKWDTEDLKMSRNRLLTEKNNLEQNKDTVVHLKEEIYEKWQSISSEIYLESLETDILNLNYLIKGVEELAELLGKVITEAYEECEEEMKKKLSKLNASIHKL